ncbi:hypothetical protein FXO38_30589 [Capsicum annuum]|nr:hypothetical protein FXO38_30589 [Capsicum annuum]
MGPTDLEGCLGHTNLRHEWSNVSVRISVIKSSETCSDEGLEKTRKPITSPVANGSSVMKKIDERCGEWLETVEETDLKNHLRWVRIRVRGLTCKIPTSIENADGEFVFTLPIWVTAPATYRKKTRKRDHIGGREEKE